MMTKKEDNDQSYSKAYYLQKSEKTKETNDDLKISLEDSQDVYRGLYQVEFGSDSLTWASDDTDPYFGKAIHKLRKFLRADVFWDPDTERYMMPFVLRRFYLNDETLKQIAEERRNLPYSVSKVASQLKEQMDLLTEALDIDEEQARDLFEILKIENKVSNLRERSRMRGEAPDDLL